MAPLFVLMHSPSVGPATWTPVAGKLARRGHEALVPSLLTVGAGEPPAGPRVVAGVVGALAAVPLDRPVRRIPGHHLHQIVDPAAVADALISLVRRIAE